VLRSAYSRLYRRLPVPRSVAAQPRLPDEPVSRRFGLDRGRPVDRVFIERFLASRAADVRGRVLEVAEPTYTRRFGGDAVTRSDVVDASDSNPQATLVGDLRERGWLPDRAFDCVILTQVLQYAREPRAVLDVVGAAMAPGGVLLATFPSVSHRSPDGEADAFPDLWRFTSDGVRALLDAAGWRADVRAHGNLLSCAAFLYGMAEHETDPRAFAFDDPAYEVVVTVRATLEP
jgi:SAM-dependent methyltransferase